MSIPNDKLILIYRFMKLTRRFEETVEDLSKQKRIIGSIHLSIGEEATAIGVSSAINYDDILSPSYRDTGVFFYRGVKPAEIMGMLFAKESGFSRGRTRVLHIGDLDKNLLPANPILGASSAIAIGAALAIKKKQANRVVVNIFGDGASNEGAVHEAMNFASTFQLPIVFVIVNNQYAWSTPTSKSFNSYTIADRAKAYGFPGYIVNGNNVLEVYDVVENVCNRARQGYGPALVECRTYRWSGHSANDKNVYRSEEERIRWRQDCPIGKFEKYLVAVGALDEIRIAQIKQEIEEEIQEAVAQAEKSPFPDPEELLAPEVMLYQ